VWHRHWLRARFRLDRVLGRAPPRVVFLHIPKCGGTTINRHFKWNFGNARSGMLAEIDSMCGAGEAVLARARAAQYVFGHFGWATMQAVEHNAVRFTVVREPFERLRSLYLYAKALGEGDHPVFRKVLACAKTHPFEGFCLSDDGEVRALIDNAQTRTLADDYFPFREQDRAMTLRRARENLEALDFVIDQRDIDAAYPQIAARTHTRLLRSQRRLNVTPRRPENVMSRQAFLRDRQLSALIAQDLDVYDHAQAMALRS
jgi:hypothetical protein